MVRRSRVIPGGTEKMFADSFGVDVRERRIKDDSVAFSLSSWRNGITINLDHAC